MNAPSQGSRVPWSVFWVAFAVRVLYLTLAHTYRIRANDDHMLFGEEMGESPAHWPPATASLIHFAATPDPLHG